ncbi:Uma2 family endonuclease [Actinomadura sp. 21ATH]|uniref:Uma2 family endonuclease n=1 Tax=Actinomadura sp. 21ATH TaxID=1735444 RepID=UPI0035BEF906
MTHTLLHQVLVSSLVVPVGLAEPAGQRSATSTGAWLDERTWLRADLMVFREEQEDPRTGYVRGAPLLAVEVTSDASREPDLGAKKDVYERFGVPSYWVVDMKGDAPELLVYELSDDGRYAEEARVGWGRSCSLTRPFPIEVTPDEIFRRLPCRPAPRRLMTVTEQTAERAGTDRIGPDLPHSEDPILIDAFGRRWPTGAEKVELWDGCPVFYGGWDERDVEIAERAYPGRVVRLDQPPGELGTMTILPGPSPEPDDAEDPEITLDAEETVEPAAKETAGSKETPDPEG